MQLNKLDKFNDKSKKRIGRGIGSGRGKTSGRGTKGQKARGSVPASFIGGSLPLYKKLPYRRGLGNSKVSLKPVIVQVEALNVLKTNSVVDVDSLIKANIVLGKEATKQGVKILGNGALKIALEVKVPVSKTAQAIIEKAGGKVG